MSARSFDAFTAISRIKCTCAGIDGTVGPIEITQL